MSEFNQLFTMSYEILVMIEKDNEFGNDSVNVNQSLFLNSEATIWSLVMCSLRSLLC